MEDLGVSATAGTTNRQCQRLENLRRALYARMSIKSTNRRRLAIRPSVVISRRLWLCERTIGG